jgi:transcriptional regulator with XRE-family HTH domain
MIRDARLAKGLTQDELAKRIGTKQATVATWEIGYSFPRPSMLPRLSEVLEIPIDELVKAG